MSEGEPVDPRKLEAGRAAFERLMDMYAAELEFRPDATRLQLYRETLEYVVASPGTEEHVREWARKGLKSLDEREQ
jgi:hypothetical protein